MIDETIFEMKTFFPNSILIQTNNNINNCLQSMSSIEDSILFIRNGKLRLSSKLN